MKNEINFNHFIEAQHNSYENALKELSQGRKETHWMWYIFPQIAGLSNSELSVKFSIHSEEEAIAYLKHPLLGKRLIECTELLLRNCDSSTIPVLGKTDSLKFRSSITLFAYANPDTVLFKEAIIKLFDGKSDLKTIKFLKSLKTT